MPTGPKGQKRHRDANQLAKLIVDVATTAAVIAAVTFAVYRVDARHKAEATDALPAADRKADDDALDRAIDDYFVWHQGTSAGDKAHNQAIEDYYRLHPEYDPCPRRVPDCLAAATRPSQISN